MAMYGIAILPLIKRVMSNDVTHKWFADDGNAAGSIASLSKLYHDLKEIRSSLRLQSYQMSSYNKIRL